MRRVREIICGGLLLLAVASDYQRWKIPNALVITGWLCAMLWNMNHYGIFQGGCVWLSGGIIPIILLWIFFLSHTIGAGDIKLFSVIGSFYGNYFCFWTFITAILISGVMSLIQLVSKGMLANRMQYLAKYLFHFMKEKKLTQYYNWQRDGENCVIHLSGAIAGGYLAALFLL